MTFHGKRSSGKRKPLLPPAMKPWLCVVLAIDPGALSGWALFVRGKLVDFGEGNKPLDRRLACYRAATTANDNGLPLIIVGETWTRHGDWSFESTLGLGAAWGRWLEGIDEAPQVNIGQWRGPKIIRVLLDDWRRAIFGSRSMQYTNHTSDEWKDMAVRRARVTPRAEGVWHSDNGNVCEAILIGEFGTRSGEVGEALPAAFRRAA